MPNIPKNINKIIDEFVKGTRKILGNRLKKIILYGSYARGDYNESSDIDIMILTDLTDDEIIKYRNEIWDFAYDIECDNNFIVDLSPLVKNIDRFNYWSDTMPFYMNIVKDGIVLYMNNKAKELAEYRLKKAKEALETSILLYNDNNSYLRGINNRAYYAILYVIRAVLVLERIDFKKHKEVIAYFNKNYVSTEIFPKDIGAKIVQANKVREDSDYDDEFEPSAEETKMQIDTARELIDLVEKYIESKTTES